MQQSFIALPDQEVNSVVGKCGMQLLDDGGGKYDISNEGGLDE